MTSPYETLGLVADTPFELVREQFFALAASSHPDNGGDPEAFHKLREAFETIASETSRTAPDSVGSSLKDCFERDGSGKPDKAWKGFLGEATTKRSVEDGTYLAEDGAGSEEERARGNSFFKQHRYRDAVVAYTAAIHALQGQLDEELCGTATEQAARRRVENALLRLEQDYQDLETKTMGELTQARAQLDAARAEGEAAYKRALEQLGGDPEVKVREILKRKDPEKNPVVMAARKHEAVVAAAAATRRSIRSRAARLPLLATLLSNRAAAHLELQDYERGRQDAEMAMRWDLSNHKAAYRAARACRELGELQEAARLCIQVENFHSNLAAQGLGAGAEPPLRLRQLLASVNAALESCAKHRLDRALTHQYHAVGGQEHAQEAGRLLQAFMSIPKALLEDLKRPANVVRAPPHTAGEIEHEWLVQALVKETPIGFGDPHQAPAGESADAAQARFETFKQWSDKVRMPVCCHFAFGTPSVPVLRAIAEFSRGAVVEVGAGTGYWAKLLKQRHGVDCMCYDIDAGEGTQSVTGAGTKLHQLQHAPVQAGGAECSRLHRERTLLLCWPPSEDPMALQALESYRGQQVVYVGEWEADLAGPGEYPPLPARGPATATRAFREKLLAEFERIGRLPLTTWPGFHDDCTFWVRKAEQVGQAGDGGSLSTAFEGVQLDTYIPGVTGPARLWDPTKK